MSKKVTYIIPLHKKDDRVFKAISSVPVGMPVIVSIPDGLKTWLNKGIDKLGERKDQVTFVRSKGGFNYPHLVNLALAEVGECDFISVLEFDDTLMPNAHRILDTYSEAWPEAEILAPLSCVVKIAEDQDKPVLIGIANEATLAPGMAEQYGYLDFNMMLRTNFIFVNGCYIKPSVFEDYGRFKENFDMFYDYEWALRVVYNGGIIRSIPKATHFHALTDDGAFETQKAAPQAIRENWLGAARREYFFEEDREISFN